MPQLQWVGSNTNPWGDQNSSSPLVSYQEVQAPLDINAPPTGEFSINQYIPTTLSNAVKNASRLLDSSSGPIRQNDDTPAWYNIPARLSNAVSGVNDALQSTLIKVIVLVAIVGVVAVFGMSYVQTKGAKLAA